MEIVCVWCQTRESQSEKNILIGDACFESAFLFNKYFKNKDIDKKSI